MSATMATHNDPTAYVAGARGHDGEVIYATYLHLWRVVSSTNHQAAAQRDAFKMDKSLRMRDIMVRCDYHLPGSGKFYVYNDQILEPDQLLSELNLKDGDEIKIRMRCTRPGGPAPRRLTDLTGSSFDSVRDISPEACMIVTAKYTTGYTQSYLISSTTNLDLLKAAFEEQIGRQRLRFLMQGTMLWGRDTAQKIDMKDGDMIDVCAEQYGGCIFIVVD